MLSLRGIFLELGRRTRKKRVIGLERIGEVVRGAAVRDIFRERGGPEEVLPGGYLQERKVLFRGEGGELLFGFF